MNKKIKILLVISKYYPEYAGPGFRLHNTYKRLDEKYGNVEYEVICNSTEYKKSDVYTYEDIKITRINSSFFNMENSRIKLINKVATVLKSYMEAVKTLRYFWKKNFHIIHTAGGSSSVATAVIWSRITNTPIITELVTDGASPKMTLPGLRYIWEPVLKNNAVVITISEDLLNKCQSFGISENVWCRPNPVNDDKFYYVDSADKSSRKEDIDIDNKDILLLSVAKIMPQKNQIFLVDIMNKLPSKYKLIIAGPLVNSGPLYDRDFNYLQEMKNKISELSLDNRIKVISTFVQAEKYIQAADVYLIPSIQEGLSTPMIESLSCGVPVIANEEIPCFKQWVINGKNGFLRKLCIEEWVAAIEDIVNDATIDMENEAENMKGKASMNIIDDSYMKIINYLSSSSSFDQKLDISKIL